MNRMVHLFLTLSPLILLGIIAYIWARRSELRLAQIQDESQRQLNRMSEEAAREPIRRTEIIGAQAAVIAIHNHLFSRPAKTICDISTDNEKDISILLQHVDTRTLLLALLELPTQQQELFLKPTSNRAREAFFEEMQIYRKRKITES